jgi:prophage maintenance system killer protein
MKTVLVITLGNRDVQLKKDSIIHMDHRNWFIRNNDSEEYRINTSLKEKDFLKISKEILDNYFDTYNPYFSFPMVEKSIQYLKDCNLFPEEIIFSTSGQNPPDKQDCLYVAQIASRYFTMKGYNCSVDLFSCPPTDFSALVEHYSKLFEKLPPQSYISTSGGTPDMRAATYFTGLFRNFIFISINARTGAVTTDSFRKLEQLVLKNITEKMLSVYDYEGIRNLPVSSEVKEHCTRALEQYNLVNSISEGNYLARSLQSINLLMENARICYIQGRYADTIGRIFRIEEATWHMLWYKYLTEQNLIDKNENLKWKSSSGTEKKEKYYRLIESGEAMRSFLKATHNNYFEEKNGTLYFKNHPEVSIHSGKNFFYYFFKSVGKHKSVTDFFETINKNENDEVYKSDSILNKVRNKSYLGHGFKGISKGDVEKVVGDLSDFLDNLKKLLCDEVQFQYTSFFQETNERITLLLD